MPSLTTYQKLDGKHSMGGSKGKTTHELEPLT